MAGFFWCLLSAATGADESADMMLQWQRSSHLSTARTHTYTAVGDV